MTTEPPQNQSIASHALTVLAITFYWGMAVYAVLRMVERT